MLARVVACLLLLWLPHAHAGEPSTEWELMGNEDGIELFRRNVPGTKIIALKGHGAVDAPVWKVAGILLDTKRAPEWVDSLEQSRVLKRLKIDAYIEYNHIGTPFIMKDRDFVSEVKIEVDPKAKSVALKYHPSTDDAGVPPSGHVRGELTGLFQVTTVGAEKKSDLTAELLCDPQGAVPKWIVNLFQKSWPRNTFESIRKQALKPDTGIPDEFKDVLAPSLAF